MAQHPEPNARLHVLFARDVPIGVIFRRGPRRLVRLILWHTDTDTFEPGQWLKGEIEADGAALSPNGQLLAYFAIDYHPRRSKEVGQPSFARWYAVSRPPYLTALGLWFTYENYSGLAAFPDNQTLLLHRLGEQYGFEERASDSGLPPWLRVHSLPPGWNVARDRGWSVMADTSRQLHRHAKMLSDTRFALESEAALDLHWSIWKHRWLLRRVSDGQTRSWEVEQAEVDPAGRLIVVRGGKLLAATVAQDLSVTETELADFSDMVFEPIPPPEWAKKWPEL